MLLVYGLFQAVSGAYLHKINILLSANPPQNPQHLIILLLPLQLSKYLPCLLLQHHIVALPIVETDLVVSLLVVVLAGGVRAYHVFTMECKQELLVLIVVHLMVDFVFHGPLYQLDDIEIPHELVLASLENLLAVNSCSEFCCAFL